jgi:hypothetical protein
MSVEVNIVPRGNNQETENHILDSGCAILLSDYSTGSKKYLGIECLQNGRPRFVVLPNEGPLAAEGAEPFSSDDLPIPDESVFLDEKELFEVPLVDESYVLKGVVRVQYVDDCKITPTGLIPRTLRHHN